MALLLKSPGAGAVWFGAAVLICLMVAGCATAPGPRIAYPPSRLGDQTDTWHGTTVPDPYRWLEALDSPETRAWVEAQNRVTFDWLGAVPERAGLRKRLQELWNYERFGIPARHGSRYFYTRNNGLQNQAVLLSAPSLDAPPAVLLDPNTLSADGTIALAGMSVSDDGRLLAYGLSGAGSDWQTWKIRDVETGRDLPDELRWVKFSGAAWTPDSRGFFYSRYDEPKGVNEYSAVNQFQKLYFHRLGDPQSADALILRRDDQPRWGFGGHVTDDGRYLIISVSRGTDVKNALFYKDLADPASPVVELLRDFDADYQFIGNDGPVFWLRTDLNAPRGRLIALDITRPARENWRELIPQSASTLVHVSAVHRQFICQYLQDAHSRAELRRLDGSLIREIALPGLGSASGFGGRMSDTETFFAYTSFTTPALICRLDLESGQQSVFRRPKTAFNPDDYETRQVFFTSKDGTRVPMFLTGRKGLKPSGNIPTVLYGYGGFNISITPAFSVGNLVWLEQGGLLAVPSLRGGGEYGEDWHQAGMKARKQNVFDDFIGAAEWLVAHHWTRPSKLAISGGSNGGLLVGACMTQRPELFGAALPAVGVLDMLRFHKHTIGWAWTAEYGAPEDPAEFKALYAYSPLHALKPGVRYPATLITTGDHDDRVVPMHSFKFAARLQACQAAGAPALIRIEVRAGHGAGKPTAKLIDETADKWAFLFRALHLTATPAP